MNTTRTNFKQTDTHEKRRHSEIHYKSYLQEYSKHGGTQQHAASVMIQESAALLKDSSYETKLI